MGRKGYHGGHIHLILPDVSPNDQPVEHRTKNEQRNSLQKCHRNMPVYIGSQAEFWVKW
jgi:hypothetical protein